MKSKGLETSTTMMVAYSTLAMEHRRNYESLISVAKLTGKPKPEVYSAGTGIALISLNAAILEGAIRALVSERLHQIVEEATKEGQTAGRKQPSLAEKMLYRFREDTELRGGWEKLLEQFSIVFGFTLKEISGEDIFSAFDHMFRLRNIYSHGTALIIPETTMTDDMKDIYPFKWQTNLQGTRVYLKKHFGSEDLLEASGIYEVPSHFWSATKEFFLSKATDLDVKTERATNIIDRLGGYEFGYRFT